MSLSPPKKYKKLGNWLKRLTSIRLVPIARNATHTHKELVELPIAAALENSSIEYMSQLDSYISADSFYNHANGKLTEEVIIRMNHRLCAEIIKLLKNIKQTSHFSIAIDYTEDRYYGETDNEFVVGGKRKDGTNYGFKYLTVAILEDGIKYVIFAYPVKKTDTVDALMVEKGLWAVQGLGIQIRRVLLDREFYNADIIAMCNLLGIEFIIPSKKDERFTNMLDSTIAQKKRNGLKMQYPRIIEDYPLGDQLVNQVLFEEKNSKDELEIHAYVTNRKAADIKIDPYAVQDDYRGRWTIENANKFQDSFNIHTNSPNGLVRFFFFSLTMILHNCWVLVNMYALVFSLYKVSLNMFKELAKAVLCFAPCPHYKHPQRERWVEILVG